MFLKSITTCGFMNIRGTKKINLKFNEESFNEISNENSFFETAFSIIFDAKYGVDWKFDEIINAGRKGESFIEVVLWQSDKETLGDYQWLKKNHLTLRRNLQDPNFMIVNGKKIDVELAHQSLSSLGILKDFCMHRLLSEEITKLKLYTGDDLWNLLNQMNQCEELVQIIETKHKSKQIVGAQVKQELQEMENILPYKLKLRDEVRSHAQLFKKFNTILSVIDSRKLEILSMERDVFKEGLDELILELRKKGKEVRAEQLRVFGPYMKFKADERLKRLLACEIKALKLKISEDSNSTELQRFDKIHKSTISSVSDFENLLEAQKTSEFFKTKTEFEINQWKLKMKANDPEARKMLQNNLNSSRKSVEKWSKELTDLEKNIQYCKNQLKLPENDDENQLEFLENIHKQNLVILASNKEIIDCDRRIEVELATGSCEFIATLKTIEILIAGNKNLGYYGPAFIFLESRSEIDRKLWPVIKTLATTLLFSHGKDARKVNRLIIESGEKLGPYVLLGLDEFVPETVAQWPDSVTSAEVLVREDVDESIKVGLKAMLRGILLVEEGDEGEELEKIVVHCDEKLKIKSRGKIIFHILDPHQTDNPIKDLQELYANIRKRVELTVKIESAKSIQVSLESQLLGEHRVNVELICSALNRLKEIFLMKIDLQDLMTEKLAVKQELEVALKENSDSWDVKKLEEVKEKKRGELRKATESRKLQRMDLEHKLKKLEISSSLLKTMRSLKLTFDLSAEAKTAMKPKYQEQLSKLMEELKELRKVEQLKIFPEDQHLINTELELQLSELESRLKSKISEKIKFESAIELCSDTNVNIDRELFKKLRKEPIEKISEQLSEVQQDLKQKTNTETMTNEQYGHLVESINKIKDYSTSPMPVIERNKIAAKAFPIMNKFLVKTLKDAVHNYQTSFRCITANFIKKSTLFFYTREVFDGVNGDDFSWNCFDMRRIKALDFAVEWKENGRKKIEVESFRKVKGLLLIMHIISYLSVFKFIVIDEEFFDNMDEVLVQNLKRFLETVSKFVQVIMLKSETKNDVKTEEKTIQEDDKESGVDELEFSEQIE